MEKVTYQITISNEYGHNEVIEFESVYEAQERLLDSIELSESSWQLRALLAEVEADILEMEDSE